MLLFFGAPGLGCVPPLGPETTVVYGKSQFSSDHYWELKYGAVFNTDGYQRRICEQPI